MSADFFKNRGLLILTGLALSLVLALLGYANSLYRAHAVQINTALYFLVVEDTHVEASAELAKLDGGAGYLLTSEQGVEVALAVYLREGEGQEIARKLTECGRAVKLQKQEIKTLYFQGRERRKSETYISALQTLKGEMAVLENCISRLEKGMTQESCKRILRLLERQFLYAEKTYVEYEEFSSLCAASAEQLAKFCGGIVYLQDLRYLLCEQAEGYLRLCEAFCL